MRRAIVLFAIVIMLAASSGGAALGVPADQIATPFVQTEQIVVALRDLPRGTLLTEAMVYGNSPAVAVVAWPLGSLPESFNYYTDPQAVIGYWVRNDIPRGTPIMSRLLVDDVIYLGAVGSDLALTVEYGEYAVPVRLTVIRSMPEDLALYDTVAVMGVFDTGESSPRTLEIVPTAVILEIQPDLTLAVADYTEVMMLVWAQDNNISLRFVRHAPG